MNSLFQKKTRVSDSVLKALIYLSALAVFALVFMIIAFIVVRAVPHLNLSFFTTAKSTLKGTDGILSNMINTIYVIVLTLAIAGPIGVGGAIYLNEYAKNQKFVQVVSFALEVLSGIPSIIYGLFGMIFFGEKLHLGYSILNGSLTLSLMILPILTRNAQLALTSVPQSYREAARGLGAQKWYMIRTVLLPSAIPGILTGVILAMGRIVAESAVLIFTAGAGYAMPTSFLGHVLKSGGTLTVRLYFEMNNANYAAAFLIALLLIGIVLAMNALAKWIAKKFDVNGG